jgi:prepilin-type N-terminal cleavage/methylation domain-containing protein
MRDRKKAFTLVEVLVVISIIAMLLGILMPTLSAGRRLAKKAVCKANLHNCALAFKMYLDDNKNIMPTIDNMPNDANIHPHPIPIYSVIGKYLGNQEALRCPADKGTVIETSFFDSTAPQAAKDADCYFTDEGSSYEYNTRLNNENIDKDRFAQRFGQNEIFLLRDYSAFHGRPGQAGSVMYLYADTLVADRERNK